MYRGWKASERQLERSWGVTVNWRVLQLVGGHRLLTLVDELPSLRLLPLLVEGVAGFGEQVIFLRTLFLDFLLGLLGVRHQAHDFVQQLLPQPDKGHPFLPAVPFGYLFFLGVRNKALFLTLPLNFQIMRTLNFPSLGFLMYICCSQVREGSVGVWFTRKVIDSKDFAIPRGK